MNTFLWHLYVWWLEQRAAFLNSPIEQKEDTILGIVAAAICLLVLPQVL